MVHLGGGEDMEPFVQGKETLMLLHLEPWCVEHKEITAGFTGRQGGASKSLMTA